MEDELTVLIKEINETLDSIERAVKLRVGLDRFVIDTNQSLLKLAKIVQSLQEDVRWVK